MLRCQISETDGADEPAIEECGPEEGRQLGIKSEVWHEVGCFCDNQTDKPAHHHAGGIDEPHRFHQPQSLVVHVRLWGRGGVGKDALPGAWATCGALKRRSSSGQAKRASVTHRQPHALLVARRLDWLGSLDPDSWMAGLSSIGSEREEGLSRDGRKHDQPETSSTPRTLATTVATVGCGFFFIFFFFFTNIAVVVVTTGNKITLPRRGIRDP